MSATAPSARASLSLRRDAPPGPPLLALDGVSKRYGRNAAVLQDVSLAIYPGQRVALIGANGAGKSTLLKCLVAVHASSSGETTALGERIRGRPSRAQQRRIRRRLGFVFQAPCLVAQLSALSNVVHGKFGGSGSWRGWHQAVAPAAWRRDALRALAAVGLERQAEVRADQLSGGQQQRVAIARSLVREPSVLIADEPAASLDPSAGRDVMRHLCGLTTTRGTTLVFTTHDMRHALDYAQRVVALRRGRVLFDRPAERLSAADLDGVFDD